MTIQITDVYDRKRLCGWRHEGGFYLRTDPANIGSCGKFPLILNECDCCGQKVKLTRSLQKINVQGLFKNVDCDDPRELCKACLINRTGYGYLISIGHKFYPSRDDFKREAIEMGISKRIAFPLPREFKVKESMVLLGHPRVFTDLVAESSIEIEHAEIDEDAPQKGLPMIVPKSITTGKMVVKDIGAVVMMFVPQRIEYIVSGTETDQFLEQLVSQNVTLVRVHRVEDHQLALEDARTE